MSVKETGSRGAVLHYKSCSGELMTISSILPLVSHAGGLMSLLFEDLFKRLNSDLKRMADSVLSKVISKRMIRFKDIEAS